MVTPISVTHQCITIRFKNKQIIQVIKTIKLNRCQWCANLKLFFLQRGLNDRVGFIRLGVSEYVTYKTININYLNLMEATRKSQNFIQTAQFGRQDRLG